jgi:hypothetical protein
MSKGKPSEDICLWQKSRPFINQPRQLNAKQIPTESAIYKLYLKLDRANQLFSPYSWKKYFKEVLNVSIISDVSGISA